MLLRYECYGVMSNPTEAAQIVRTLKESGTPVWYLVAKDEGHGFDKKSNADFQLYASIVFVREYLLK